MPAEPIALRIKGRGDFFGQMQFINERFRIRVDDRRDTAFWLEISLDQQNLGDMLSAMAVDMAEGVPELPDAPGDRMFEVRFFTSAEDVGLVNKFVHVLMRREEARRG